MSAFTDPIYLEPRFSKRFAWLLAFLHFGALFCLLPLTLSWVVKIGIGLGILWCAYQTSRKHLWFVDHPLYRCTLSDDSVLLSTGEKASISSSSYIHPQLVVLRVTESNKAYYLILFPDALDETTFRRLRVRLRHAFLPK
jgi:hypothetical protein